MGGLSNLKELFTRRETFIAPMDDPFIQIDKNATSERMRLRERGAEQGALNLPGEQFRTLDAVESEIIAHVLETYARAQSDAAGHIRTYDGRMAELSLLTSSGTITAQALRAVGDFKVSVQDALNNLANTRDAIESSYAELREFRKTHDLRRPAHRSLSKVSAFSGIALAWFVETLLNALLLRQNDDMGYLGGALAAGIIGALNVGLAGFVGRLVWPLTVHRSASKRVIGWVLTGAWIFVVFIWNWAAGHYRDAKVLGLENPESQALAMLSGNLDSLYSWGLLLAGFMFAISAALAGFRMDDPYPGYGPIARRHEDRCKAYASDVADAAEDLKEIRDNRIEEAAAVRDELDSQFAERGQILAARAAFSRRFGEFGDQLSVIANALLQDYRTANIAARQSPAPETFSMAWVLPKSVLPEPPVATVTDADIRAAEQALDSAVAEISRAFDDAITRFEPLDQLKRRLADG